MHRQLTSGGQDYLLKWGRVPKRFMPTSGMFVLLPKSHGMSHRCMVCIAWLPAHPPAQPIVFLLTKRIGFTSENWYVSPRVDKMAWQLQQSDGETVKPRLFEVISLPTESGLSSWGFGLLSESSLMQLMLN